MRKLVALAILAVGLATPRTAGADPIGTNGCVVDPATFFYTCDLYADYSTTSASMLGTTAADPNPGGYLLAYAFLLGGTADLSDGLEMGEVSQILVIHDSLFELFSNTVYNSSAFALAFANALTGVDIDGSPAGQLAGLPTTNGVTTLYGTNTNVGYAFVADMVTLRPDTIFGCCDILNIHTAPPIVDEEPPPTTVPEPSSLSLLVLGVGCLVPALRRRRQTGKAE